jgi:hypothetical protein
LNKDEISEGKWFIINDIDRLIKSSECLFSDSFIFVWKNGGKILDDSFFIKDNLN